MRFINLNLILFILLALFVLFLPVMAQTSETSSGVDWTTIGVDAVLVGIVIAAVQYVKKKFLKTAPALYTFLAVIVVSILAGLAKNWVIIQEGNVIAILKTIFFYALAAVFLYEGGKNVKKAAYDEKE